MRTGAAAGHSGYYHETAFYGSDDELLALAVPFLRDGAEAGEPTLVTLAERNAQLVRAALGETRGVTFIAGSAKYARPAETIRTYRDLFASYVARGAAQIRVVGDVPHPGLGAPWDWWARYEAAANHAFGEYPLWGLCPYDTRTTPDDVLAEVERTHPHVATADGEHVANAHFEDPRAFLARRSPARPDPLEMSPPAAELGDPSPAAARRAVLTVAGPALDATEVADLTIATSEAVSNAWMHGVPPVRVRLWSAPDRVVVTVSDRGPGPADPFAGLLPADKGGAGGLGLWMAHQLCNHVTLDRTDDGFTIRLVAGRPHAA